ncbi:hypothetical protein EOD39_21228 [Acipenser ruthenus]|uniref:Uncharacterized protein n=1 Tax=Acipenser ruthenus TaxID=7906 RepID=A0A444UTA0_ACIRT|nr:hypothetical protein EOD39_21228 [Acipenser ruthenus]
MSTSSLRRQVKNIVHNYSEAEIKQHGSALQWKNNPGSNRTVRARVYSGKDASGDVFSQEVFLYAQTTLKKTLYTRSMLIIAK